MLGVLGMALAVVKAPGRCVLLNIFLGELLELACRFRQRKGVGLCDAERKRKGWRYPIRC